ncbi:MAG: hypothetical protein IVW57_10260 [Ktedonobacterales bacterium]|nr:hypothetical protein [Ktedonobacterales bacterium]
MANARHAWSQHTVVSVLRMGALAFALTLVLGACDAGGNKSGNNGSGINLANLPWCDRPSISFQDDGTTTQSILTKWALVKDQLGFTPYLPPTLPQGSCLALAGGSIHNPIIGAQLSITYVLPKIGPLALSEAPKRASLPTALQCVANPVPGTKSETTAICQGVMESTSITLVSRQSTSDLQQIFHALQPNVEWVPSASPSAATPTSTAK